MAGIKHLTQSTKPNDTGKEISSTAWNETHDAGACADVLTDHNKATHDALGIAPASHTHAASDTTSGTFGNSRLDLSAIAQNVVFAGAQTVDGVDISALLLKASKVTNLGDIWDKTTKIAYGDTDFADQSLKTSDNVSHAVVTATGFVNSAPSIKSANPWLCTPNTTRATGVVYQNATGKNVLVYVCVVLTGNASYATNYISTVIGATSSPADSVASNTNSSVDQQVSITFMVPSGWYYKVNQGGTVSVILWSEQLL